MQNSFPRRCFDFEIGYLIKSPCRDCYLRSHLPDCSDDCTVLNKIQTILAPGISCNRANPNFPIQLPASGGGKL
jgi:hypothetical protein